MPSPIRRRLSRLTADGRVSRALSSLALQPADLRLALLEAGEGKIGGLAGRLALLCYGFDAVHGIYTAQIVNAAPDRRRSDSSGSCSVPRFAVLARQQARGLGVNQIFSLPEASTHAARVDQIFYGLLVLSGLTLLVVFSLVLILAIRYRRGSAAKRGPLPEIVSREFEIGWTAATLFLFAFLFWWAASADLGSLAAPAGALEIHVVAKQWMWKTQHPNGAREIDALHVPRRQAGPPGDDLAGRHPFVLRAGLPRQAGRGAGTRHRDLVSGHQDRASSRCSARNIAAPIIP